MASTGATHRHLQLLVLLLICASTSTTAGPVKPAFDLSDDSEWEAILDTPADKEIAIRCCEDAVEAYNIENPKGRLNGCRSVYSAKAILIDDERLALRFQLESSQRRWFGKDVDVVADMAVTISSGEGLESTVVSVVMLSVLRYHGL
ncbi:hypothetical protein AXF42_Ash010591 [Apostasia shenzhenica]|uniref:Uncharacterized protein n=1 Tax=Apostasia shenzhenica TaxID=1088818 RepID=A0A2I0A6I3_9ASPA|nr:hypothetical protein AXF42_Ash010591 [Apostasia shenzhenica]